MIYYYPTTRLSLFSSSGNPSLLSYQAGWYFIQIIAAVSISQLKQIGSNANISFNTINLVYPSCYSFYLNEQQLNYLSNYQHIFKIFPYPQNFYKPSKKIQSNSETGRCKVKSIENWTPKNPKIRFSKWSPDVYIVNSSCSTLLPDTRILHLSPYSGRKPLNRYNSGFIQSGDPNGVIENGSFVSPHPIFNLGIRGEGQIVSIIDTGVDFNHPFFRDPNAAFSINKTMKMHRKIEKYYNFAKENDGPNGHGTHCAGILAGQPIKPDSGIFLYRGMAPNAKIVVGDVGFGGSDLNGEFDQVGIFELFEEDGVSVCSNSWGFDADEDTRIDTIMYDYISFSHQMMLFVFAAGNEGRNGFYTINSPGDSKNILSVGGLTPTPLQSIEQPKSWCLEIGAKRFTLEYSERGLNPLTTTKGDPMQKLANLSIVEITQQSVSDNFANKIVFLDDARNKTLFCKLFKNNSVQPAAVIHIESNYSECPKTFAFPLFTLKSDMDDTVKEQIKQGASNASIFEFASNQNYKMSLAAFSSKGPSQMGLFKPDIVVPGTALSSAGGKSSLTMNSLTQKSGTSMATPVAAGSCVLVRQFFTDGYYPNRLPNATNGFTPTSFLLRAVVVNSASPFNSGNYGPNIETGFGLPNLSAALLQPLRLVKNASISSKEKHRYAINLTSKNRSLSVTMAYIDPPLSFAASAALFADLDLIVIAPSGKTYIGNERPNRQTEMANTIERVIVPMEDVEIGQYKILVLSNNFSDPDVDAINYSVVVNGPFDHFDFENNKAELELIEQSSEKCEFKCRNNGVCSDSGFCECDSNHSGFDCSIEFKQLNLSKVYPLVLNPSVTSYFKVHIGEIKNRINISSRVYLNTSDKHQSVFMYVSDSKFSSLSDSNTISINIKKKDKQAFNLTVSQDENDQISNLDIFVALKIVSAMESNVDFSINVVDFPLSPSERSTKTPEKTEFQHETSQILVLAPSKSEEVHLTSSPTNVPSVEVDSEEKYYSNDMKGLNYISLLLSFTMLSLLFVILVFLVMMIYQIKRKNEIGMFFSREIEPKLSIVEENQEIV